MLYLPRLNACGWAGWHPVKISAAKKEGARLLEMADLCSQGGQGLSPKEPSEWLGIEGEKWWLVIEKDEKHQNNKNRSRAEIIALSPEKHFLLKEQKFNILLKT